MPARPSGSPSSPAAKTGRRGALDPFRVVSVTASAAKAAELAKRFGESLTAARLPLCAVGPEGDCLDLADAAALPIDALAQARKPR